MNHVILSNRCFVVAASAGLLSWCDFAGLLYASGEAARAILAVGFALAVSFWQRKAVDVHGPSRLAVSHVHSCLAGSGVAIE